jgi:hypothetical protein
MKKLLFSLLLVATCQAAEDTPKKSNNHEASALNMKKWKEKVRADLNRTPKKNKELTRMEVDIAAEQKKFITAYEKNDYSTLLQLLEDRIKIPIWVQKDINLEISPTTTMVRMLNHLAISKNNIKHSLGINELEGIEITRILAQQGVTGNTRAYDKEGKKWHRTPFWCLLHSCKKSNLFAKNMAAIFLAYGDDPKQAKEEALAYEREDSRIIQKEKLEEQENAIDAFFASKKLQELIEREKAFRDACKQKISGKIIILGKKQ